MTEWTDAEISRRLALAIGWTRPGMFVRFVDQAVMVHLHGGLYRKFDYRDPAVIWPIAERFNAFPFNVVDEWEVYIPDIEKYVLADTAAKAVALAVIKAKEQE